MPFPYPYDPSGGEPTNLIANELHSVVPPSDPHRANFIVPRAAPFFQAGSVLRTGPLNTDPVLVEGQDYIYTHYFVEATRSLGRPVFGSVMFLDRNYTGDIYMTYQTLGGSYTLDDYSIIENLTRSLYNLRIVTWTQIVGLIAAFPPEEHPHDTADLTGMTDVVAVIQQIVDAIVAQGANMPSLVATLMNHITGPASHTKAQVGLSLVSNFATATALDADNNSASTFATPSIVSYMIGVALNTLWNRLRANGIDADLQATNLLSAGTDLNTVVGTGEYYFDTAINPVLGAPCTRGILTVSRRNANNLCQFVQSSDLDGRLYTRTRVDPTWGNWKQWITLADVPNTNNFLGEMTILTAGTHNVTVLPGETIRAILIGGGGGGGGYTTDGHPGGNTTMTIPLGLIATANGGAAGSGGYGAESNIYYLDPPARTDSSFVRQFFPRFFVNYQNNDTFLPTALDAYGDGGNRNPTVPSNWRVASIGGQAGCIDVTYRNDTNANQIVTFVVGAGGLKGDAGAGDGASGAVGIVAASV